tara:strand:- start:367 stop:702 length:336 start_codon:yes stop_codon:yes gene_type:complete
MKYSYALKWITQRITAFILIPSTFWFIYQCISFKKFNYDELQLFFQSYFNSFLFTLMMFAMLIHAKLGCETIIQDYVKMPFLKFFLNFSLNFVVILLLFLVLLAIIKLNII